MISRDHLLFVIGINSGLRIGDLLKMRVGEVIDDEGELKEFYELREGKNGKTKRFPFSSTH